jgi:hypothetical protein
MVAQLKASPDYPSEEARSQAFRAAGGGCRATYFNWANQLQPTVAVPRIPLKYAYAPLRGSSSKGTTPGRTGPVRRGRTNR